MTEQSIARMRQTLRETRARHAEGFASDDELLRAEVQFTNLETRLLLTRNQVPRRAANCCWSSAPTRCRRSSCPARLANCAWSRARATTRRTPTCWPRRAPPSLPRRAKRSCGRRRSPPAPTCANCELRKTSPRSRWKSRRTRPCRWYGRSAEWTSGVADEDEDEVFGSALPPSGRKTEYAAVGPCGVGRPVGAGTDIQRLQPRVTVGAAARGTAPGRQPAAPGGARDGTSGPHFVRRVARGAAPRAAGMRLAVTQSQQSYEVATARTAPGWGASSTCSRRDHAARVGVQLRAGGIRLLDRCVAARSRHGTGTTGRDRRRARTAERWLTPRNCPLPTAVGSFPPSGVPAGPFRTRAAPAGVAAGGAAGTGGRRLPAAPGRRRRRRCG